MVKGAFKINITHNNITISKEVHRESAFGASAKPTR